MVRKLDNDFLLQTTFHFHIEALHSVNPVNFRQIVEIKCDDE